MNAQNNNTAHQPLSPQAQSIVSIAALTAVGDLANLKTELNTGLDAGLTINEIKEILVQMYAYCGFPRSLNGVSTFMSVLDAREKKGIKDEPGKDPRPLPTGKSSVELGTENQTKLIGAPATGKYIAFAPAIDQFLKGHLFGDIFARDNLDWQSREIATVAALANLDGVNPQLQSHFNIALNTGVTDAQLKGIIGVIEAKVGAKQGSNASELLSKVAAAK